MAEHHNKVVLGIDINLNTIKKHEEIGYNVIQGDVNDLNFWQRINMSKNLPLVILTTPNHSTHMHVIEQLNLIHCNIQVAAISRYDDELKELQGAGVQVVFNLYEEAGFGFAEHIYKQIYEQEKT